MTDHLEPTEFSDEYWMARALGLAQRGEGLVEPNPMVGCVIVRNGKCLGEGFHEQFGGPHAEVAALRDAGECRGAEAFVTLEPCCHFGKTPPCSQTLIEAGISRVVVATRDPFPKVDGGGVAELEAAGLTVTIGVLEDQARELLAPYLRRVTGQRPWVIGKWAMSLDGKIATRTGDSQWISNEASRRQVHRLRGRVDAIITGIGSVLADDPLLTARPPGPRVARRVVVDSLARLPLESQLVATANEIPLTIACGESADLDRRNRLANAGCEIWIGPDDRDQRLRELLQWLAEQGATNAMLECGGELLGGFWRNRLIDETHVYIASTLIGGVNAPGPIGGVGAELLGDALPMRFVRRETLDGDVLVVARTSHIPIV